MQLCNNAIIVIAHKTVESTVLIFICLLVLRLLLFVDESISYQLDCSIEAFNSELSHFTNKIHIYAVITAYY